MEVTDQSGCVYVWISSKPATTLGQNKGSSFARCCTSVTIIVLKGIKSPLSIKIHTMRSTLLLLLYTTITLEWLKMKKMVCTARMFSGCNNKCERILMHHRRSRGNVSKTQELLYSFVWLVSSYKLLNISPVFRKGFITSRV